MTLSLSRSCCPPLVRASQVSVSWGGLPLFSELHFLVREHAHLALVGANGTGKSTLLEMLAGFLFPLAGPGSSLVWEFDTAYNTSALAARQHARLVSPQLQARYIRQGWQITGQEIILSGFSNEALAYGYADAAEQEHVQRLARYADAHELLAMPLEAMSQGQLRYTLLLRALVATPRLLLLDEPYDGLSASRRKGLSALLEYAVQQGTTLVLAVHRVEDLPACVRHLVTMSACDTEPPSVPGGEWLQVTEEEGGGTQQEGVYLASDFSSSTHSIRVWERCDATISLLDRSREEELHQDSCSACGVNPSPTAPAEVPFGALHALLPDTRSLCERWQNSGTTADGAGMVLPHATEKEVLAVAGGPSLPPVLALHDVDVYIDRMHVLRHLCWQVNAGEHWVVAGENGAGKSTLLRLLYGEEVAAYGGTVLWCGTSRPPLPWWREHVGVVSDRLHYAYEYDLTALEVVLSGRGGTIGLYDEPGEEEWTRAMLLLRHFHLENCAQKRYFTLSSGQARRVLLARAAMCSPALLLLDEPCSGLDEASRSLFFASLASVAQAGVQLLYVSHYAADVPAFFTHQLVLEGGRVITCGPRTRF